MKWLAPAAVVVLAVLAEVTLGRVGHAPDFALFFGRFHPLVVHLPIGFFLLVAMGEAATFHPKLRDRVEPALGLLLPVSAGAALAAFLMGQLLALEGGFPAASLGWHRRLTLIAVIGIAACWVVFDRQRAKAGSSRWPYRGVMGATLGVLSLGAHFGGTMTRGESYLSKYAPGPLKPLLGEPEAKKAPKEAAKPAAPAAEPLVYEHVVQPLLTKYCVDCHGTEKQKGKLRLDSLEHLLKGGENGAVVTAGLASKSPLVQRTHLPLSDDDHMPPEDKPQLKPEELPIIEFWIDRGASPTLKVKDLLPPAATRALLEHAAGGIAPQSAVPAAAPEAPSTPAPPDSATADKAPDSKAEPTTGPAAKSASASDSGSASASEPPTAAPAPPAAAPATVPASAPVALGGPAFLSAHCQKCHGAQKQKGKLRVDSVAALLKGGAKGAALVPGSPDKSTVVQRLRLPLEDDDHMPPKKEPQPTPAEIASFVSWIRNGAGASAATAASTSSSSSTTTTASSTTPASDPGTATAAVTTPASDSASDSASPSASETPPADTAAATTTPAPSGPPDPALLQSLPPHVVLFSDAIQPLFRTKCGKCHIKDSPAGGLGVDQHKALLEGGFSGPGIVPAHREKSFVMARLVLPASDDEHMPPEGEPQLSPDEVELVGSWIDQGAPAGAPTETAKLTGGAVRALSALGVKPGPEPLAAKSGGCAACSVPGGAPHSAWLEAQSLALLAATGLALARRRRRAA